MTESAPRPRQVTIASVIAGLGASLVLVNIFSVMANWGSADLREQVEDALDGGPFGPADLSVETALEMLRIMLMVVAAGCVAAVVFAVYTARRHRSARIGLTVLAGAWAVMSLALGLTGMLMAVIAIGCVVLLWSAEARTWFATSTPRRKTATGTPPIPPPPPYVTSAKGMPTVMSTPPRPDEPDQPTPWDSPGEQDSSAPSAGDSGPSPSREASPPPPPQPPHPPSPPPPPPPGGYTGYGPPPAGGYQPYGAYGPPATPPSVVPTKRPGTLTAAGVITIVMSSIALIPGVVITLLFAFDRESMETNQDFIDGANDLDMSVDDYVTMLGVYFGIVSVMSVAAIVLGILLLMNKRVRIPLVILSAMTILVGLFSLIWAIAAILVIVFCFVGGAGAWFDAQGYAADRARQQR